MRFIPSALEQRGMGGEADMSDVALEREVMSLFEDLLDVPETERGAWIEAHTSGRPALRTRLVALETADRSGSLPTGGAINALEDAIIPERIGAYKIIERIGRGGMGAVYRAARETGDFERTVAIKVIKPGLFTPDVVERFQRERQILAALAHPNIARLYDGGQTEDGAPYIIMEFVSGQPLLQWAEARSLPRAERIRIFRDICAAVAFAHAHLIVHRDLTPANVLITDDGAVKLIDFGIAKAADTNTTSPNDAAVAAMTMTPGYGAPERLISAQVSTSADVFSLGRLLQDLLRPDRRDTELRAIIARASATEPSQRYASVEALMADIEAWRNARPVAAYSGARTYALRKFAARHGRAVLAGCATFVLLATALGFTLAANVRAERARLQAEARFQETREIANSLLFEVFDEVSAIPGSTSARERLARTGLSYLEALAQDESAPLEVRVETAVGFVRLSQVVGGGQAGELGRFSDAAELLAEAERIISPLYAAHPSDPAVARAMTQVLLEQSGASLYSHNEVALAREQAARAAQIIEPYARQDAKAARAYIYAIRALGDTEGWEENFEAARDQHQRAEAFAAGLPQALRDDPAVMGARAANRRGLGESYHRLGMTDEARDAIDAAVTYTRAVRDGAPQNPAFVRGLTVALWYRAVVHRTNERDALARQSIEEAMANARQLRERDPNDAGALRLVATVGEVYAQILADARRFDESFVLGEEVVAAQRDLVVRAEGAAGALRTLAVTLMTNGGNFYNGGQFDRACERWREALSIFTGLEREGVLAETDRTRSMASAQDYVARSCNPPHAGLGSNL